MSRKKREGEYYIEPKVFKASLQKYYDTDVLTDDLAENIKKISYGLSYNSNFINYTYNIPKENRFVNPFYKSLFLLTFFNSKFSKKKSM